MASQVLKKFVIGIGENHTELVNGLGQADKAISSFVSKAKGALGGLGLGAGLFGIVKSFADFGNDLAMFSASTGIAVEDVSRLGGALEYFGGNADTAKSALEGLQDAAREASDWGTGPLHEAAKKYGFMFNDSNGQVKDATVLYEDLADVFGRLTKSQQMDLASSLGLDRSSVLLLQQGKTAVRELMEEQAGLAGITAEDARMSREWMMTITRLKQTFVSLGRELARALLPVVQKITKFMADLAKKFKDNRQLIERVAQVIKNNLVPAFAFAALGIGRALLPLMGYLAPLVAIALLIDDIAVFMADNGGKSVLGELLGDKGDGVRKKLKELFSGLQGILGDVLVGDFKGAFKKIKKLWLETVLPLALDLGSELMKALPQITGKILNVVKEALLASVSWIVDTLNKVTDYFGWDSPFKDVKGDEIADALEKEGSGLLEEMKENIVNFLASVFSRGGVITEETVLEKEARERGITSKTTRADLDRAKGLLPLDTSAVNPSAISDNRNFNIFNNYHTTINSNTPVNASVVKRGVESGVKQGNGGFDLFNGVAFTGGG